MEIFRVGQFFLVLGIIALVVFFGTNQAMQPAYGFFFGGVILIAFGIVLMRRFPRPRISANRFRTLRRMTGKEKREIEEEIEKAIEKKE